MVVPADCRAIRHQPEPRRMGRSRRGKDRIGDKFLDHATRCACWILGGKDQSAGTNIYMYMYFFKKGISKQVARADAL